MNEQPAHTARANEAIRPATTTRRDRAVTKRQADEDNLERAVAGLKLHTQADQYLERRILPYARFCEDQASASRLAYYWLRIPAIALGAVVPALIAANFGPVTRWVAAGLGIVVAATTGTEHFLSVGARWRHYRSTVESLKSETWRYLQLVGPYQKFSSREAALGAFVEQTEGMIREDWSAYVAIVNSETNSQARSQAAPPEGGGATAANSSAVESSAGPARG